MPNKREFPAKPASSSCCSWCVVAAVEFVFVAVVVVVVAVAVAIVVVVTVDDDIAVDVGATKLVFSSVVLNIADCA